MFVYSFLELHTTLIAWQLFRVVYDVLVSTGLIILPVLWMLVSNSVRSAGREQPDSHETAVFHIKGAGEVIIVLVFCLLPIYTVSPTDIRYQPPSAGGNTPPEVNAGSDPSSFRNHFNLSTSPVRVPAWWGLLHAVSTGLTNAVIEGLPSHQDLRETRLLLTSRNIEDPGLGKEYNDFLQLCYWPARSTYDQLHSSGVLPEAEPDDLGWAGSPWLLRTEGMYLPCETESVCEAAPPPLSNRVGEEERVSRGMGNSCADWWESIRTGVLAQGQEDQGIWDRTTTAFERIFRLSTEREREDAIVRQTLENFEVREGLSAEHGERPDGVISTVASGISDVIGTGALAGHWWTVSNILSLIKQALPILFAVISLIFITVMPLAMLFTAFRIQAVVHLSFLFFSLIFIHALLAVAGWLDHWLTVSLFEDRSLMEWFRWDDHVFGHAQKRALIDITLALVYVAMPTLWFMMMNVAGIGAGHALSQIAGGGGAATSVQTSGASMSATTAKAMGKGTGTAGQSAYRLVKTGRAE